MVVDYIPWISSPATGNVYRWQNPSITFVLKWLTRSNSLVGDLAYLKKLWLYRQRWIALMSRSWNEVLQIHRY